MTAAAVVSASTAWGAAESSPSASKEEKRELRVISAPERTERRMVLPRTAKSDVEKETVAFLGVETGPVSPTVSTQLGLQRGMGLVVNQIVPKSAAAGVLSPHDILLKLDDQHLIETRQLAVLIRSKKEGDEVTLTYLRAGKQATVKVKLGKQEVPKVALAHFPNGGAQGFLSADRFEFAIPPGQGPGEREDVDRVLSLIRPRGENPMRVEIDRQAGPGPGFRATRIYTGNSNMVLSDDEGSLDLSSKDGVKTLKAKNAKGEEVFSGPVTTPEERKAMPEEVRARLEKLEGMQDVTFHTDGDFQRPDPRVVRPRGIALPVPPMGAMAPGGPQISPLPRRMPAFF